MKSSPRLSFRLALLLPSFASILLSTPSTVPAQWEPEKKLTNGANLHADFYNTWRIAAGSSGVLHVVWQDLRDGNWEIYYKRSTDQGATWLQDKRLTKASKESYGPALFVADRQVHVAWVDKRNGNDEIYYKRSTNGGENWSKDVRLTHTPHVAIGVNWISGAFWPSITALDSIVIVVWGDYRNGQPKIYYTRSTDSGLTWSLDLPLPNASSPAGVPSLVALGPMVYIVWQNVWSEIMPTWVFCERSTDRGKHWEAPIRLNLTIGYAECPSVGCSDNHVFVFWVGGGKPYYNGSTDAGASWGKEVLVSDKAGNPRTPFLAISGRNLHVVWQDYRHGEINPMLYYKFSSDFGATWSQDVLLTSFKDWVDSPSVVVQDSVVHVIYPSYRGGNWDLFYRRNPSGNSVK